MSAMATYLEDAVLKLLRAQNITAPANVYLALYTSTSGNEAGPYTNELSTSDTTTGYPAYVRKAITFGSDPTDISGDTALGKTIANTVQIDFPANNNASNSVTIAAVGIFDSITRAAGNQLFHAALTTPKTLAVGDVLSFAVGALAVQLA